jgi:hypothetical protein
VSAIDKVVADAYQTYLGREADAAGAAYWVNELTTGTLKAADFTTAFASGAVAAGEVTPSVEHLLREAGVPGYASGGIHAGGLRLVGEDGPELEVTGPSRIYNAADTAAMLRGGDNSAEEIRQLREDLNIGLRAIAKHTMQTARRVEYLERWDYDGLPAEREEVA